MWEWLYNRYVAMCMDDCMFVFYMDFSLHCNNTKHTWQHVSKKQAFTNYWLPQLPPHDRCCPNNKENGHGLDHFAIRYISYDWSMKNIVEERVRSMWQFGLDFWSTFTLFHFVVQCFLYVATTWRSQWKEESQESKSWQ